MYRNRGRFVLFTVSGPVVAELLTVSVLNETLVEGSSAVSSAARSIETVLFVLVKGEVKVSKS